jgi:hypothetical protein
MYKMIIPLRERDLILDSRARGPWCELPYPGHPKGCRNFGKKKACPPCSRSFEDLVVPRYFLVCKPFDLETHVERMRSLHPNWSERQARCLLYWQGSLRRKTREEAISFINSTKDNLLLIDTPEATGVDVFETCRRIGMTLEKNPTKTVWKIMIIGKKKDK